MADLRSNATPDEIQAEVRSRLSFAQTWIEDQQLKAKDRLSCLSQLKTDPFLSKHVTDMPQLSQQLTFQEALFTVLDSVHIKLDLAFEHANCDVSDIVNDVLNPQDTAPGEVQTNTVIKSEDTDLSAINVTQNPVERLEDAGSSSSPAQAVPPRLRIQPRGILKNSTTAAAAPAADRVTPKRKGGLEHPSTPVKRRKQSHLHFDRNQNHRAQEETLEQAAEPVRTP